MSKIMKLTSFGAQSLDGGAFAQIRVMDSGPVARNSLYEDINGAYFDAAGSSANTLVPGQVDCTLRTHATAAAGFVTATDALIGLRGTRATLTGTDAAGTTKTCTARCASVTAEVVPGTLAVFIIDVNLSFKQVTNWA